MKIVQSVVGSVDQLALRSQSAAVDCILIMVSIKTRWHGSAEIDQGCCAADGLRQRSPAGEQDFPIYTSVFEDYPIALCFLAD